MKKYKLDKDKDKDLSGEDISKLKDFGALSANYDRVTKYGKQRPLYQDPKAMMAVVLFIVVAYVVYEFGIKEEENTPPKTEIIAQ